MEYSPDDNQWLQEIYDTIDHRNDNVKQATATLTFDEEFLPLMDTDEESFQHLQLKDMYDNHLNISNILPDISDLNDYTDKIMAGEILTDNEVTSPSTPETDVYPEQNFSPLISPGS